MEKLVIEGGKPLRGEVIVSGAKNSVLTMIKLLRALGKAVDIGKDEITVSYKDPISHVAEYKLVSTMRGSFCVLGPLLAKLKIAKVSLPGGCIIGVRPVDLHIKAVKALGANIEVENG